MGSSFFTCNKDIFIKALMIAIISQNLCTLKPRNKMNLRTNGMKCPHPQFQNTLAIFSIFLFLLFVRDSFKESCCSQVALRKKIWNRFITLSEKINVGNVQYVWVTKCSFCFYNKIT